MLQTPIFLAVLTFFVLFFVLGTHVIESEQEASKRNYTGYSLLNLAPLNNMNSVDAVLTLREMFENENNRTIYMLDDIIVMKRSTKIVVSPVIMDFVQQHLKDNGIAYHVIMPDIQTSLDRFADVNERSEYRFKGFRQDGGNIAPNYYMSYDEMVGYFHEWEAVCGKSCKVYTVGQTVEDRSITCLRINGDKQHLPIVWIDAGLDPRVWLAPATAMYLAFKITQSTDDDSAYLRDNFGWVICPSVNPDGYEYSRKYDRFWRKTRSPHGACYGADMNRNFDVHWAGAGTTDDPCSDLHRGRAAASEVETRHVQSVLRATAATGKLLMYFSLVSYGKMMLAPWSGKAMLKTEDYDYLWVVAKSGITAAESSSQKTRYAFGTAPDLRYLSSGAALDWVKHTAAVNWTYSVQVIPAADDNNFPLSVDVPATMIYASGDEMQRALTAMCRHIQQGVTVDLLELYGIEDSGPVNGNVPRMNRDEL